VGDYSFSWLCNDRLELFLIVIMENLGFVAPIPGIYFFILAGVTSFKWFYSLVFVRLLIVGQLCHMAFVEEKRSL